VQFHASLLQQILRCDQAKEVLDFAQNVGFQHDGMPSDEYLLHPIRVAALSGLFNREYINLSIQVGLLHNVYELAKIERSEIVYKYGNAVDSALSTLRIDRSKQRNNEYLQNYYTSIGNLPNNLGLVKVIDKLDNLYTLDSTSTKEMKKLYLREVKMFVVPLCNKVSPFLDSPLRELIKSLN
jgi:(p)ppGpp synthase/HD superfamily hydrolase